MCRKKHVCRVESVLVSDFPAFAAYALRVVHHFAVVRLTHCESTVDPHGAMKHWKSFIHSASERD